LKPEQQFSPRLSPAYWGIFILLGCGLGFLAGAAGALGTLTLAPALLILFPVLGLGEEAPRIAAATAIAVQIPLSFAEGLRNRRLIDLELLILLTPAAMIGTLIGALCNDVLSPLLSLIAVSAGAAVAAVYTALTIGTFEPNEGKDAATGAIAVTLKTLTLSTAAAIAGFNIGLILAPMLHRLIGSDSGEETSTVISFLFSIGVCAGALLSPAPARCAAACAGSLFIPAAVAIGMTALLTKPLGSRFVNWLSHGIPARVFAASIAAGSASICISTGAAAQLVTGLEDSAIEVILGPLCDPQPKPSAPGIREAEPSPIATEQ
jgi:uncharacterized protein